MKIPTLIRTAGASLILVGLGSAPLSAPAQIGSVDEVETILSHFHCYQATAQTPPAFALLQDQFDLLVGNAWDLALVSNPVQFCNPAEKQVTNPAGGVTVTPIVNPLNHLTFHFMLTIPPGPNREVVINNQFGEQRLRVLDWSFLLAVPTNKLREGEPSDIDHFKCHFVTAGSPVDREVRLFDQFLPNGLDVKVRQPQLLCNPTRKIHAGAAVGVFEPDAHLACYALAPTAFERSIRIDNQFAVAVPMTVGQSQSLCVPSLKKVVAANAVAEPE